MAFNTASPKAGFLQGPGPRPGVGGRSAARHLAMIVVGASVALAGVGGLVAAQTWRHSERVARANVTFQAVLAADAIAARDAVRTRAPRPAAAFTRGPPA